MFELIILAKTIFLAGWAAAFSICFNKLLIEPEMILSFKPRLVHKIASLGKHNALVSWQKNWLQLAFTKILNDCPVCLSYWAFLAVGLLFGLPTKLTFLGGFISIYLTYKLTE